MARQVVPNDGALILLDMILRDSHTIEPVWQFFLFTSPAVPGEGIVWADVTECDWAGYDRVDVVRERWAAAEVVEGVPVSVYGLPRLEWSVLEAGATVRGWGIRDVFSGRVIVIQAANELYEPELGQVVYCRPRVQLSTLVVCS